MTSTPRDSLPHHGIVVATDLGFSGAAAVTHGATWANRLNIPLIVAHVMSTGDAIAPLLPHLSESLPDDAQIVRAAEAVRAHAEVHTGPLGTNFDVALEVGRAEERLRSLCDRLSPRVLVVGASRKGSLEHALLGSTSEALLRHVGCPVLVARNEVTEGPVLVATDFLDGSLTAERAASDAARAWGRELIVVHALDVFRPLAASFEPSTMIDPATLATLRSAAEEMGASALERIGATARVLIEPGDPSRVVIEAARRLHASLIVVSSHGREGLPRVTHGSAAERIVRTSACSVLVTHLPHG